MDLNVIHTGDCLEILKDIPDDAFALTFGSPPYEFETNQPDSEYVHDVYGDDWVEWALLRFRECLRVTDGMVIWILDGSDSENGWSGVPFTLAAKLIASGFLCYKPVVHCYNRRTGDKGPLRRLNCDYEIALMFSKKRVPWLASMDADLESCQQCGSEISEDDRQDTPSVSSEWLTKAFIASFCPPGGVVFDPFSGTGTTAAVAAATGHPYVAVDIDPERVKMIERRLRAAEQLALGGFRAGSVIKGCGEQTAR